MKTSEFRDALLSEMESHRLSPRQVAATRSRVVAEETPRGWPRPRFGRKATALVSSVVALTLFVVFVGPVVGALRRRGAPLTFETSVDGVLGGSPQTAAFVSSTSEHETNVTFSDGSRLAVAKRARVRIGEVTSRGAGVMLESGELHAKIQHREKTEWFVHAGPFVVHVTGTEFVTAWDPVGEAVRVRLIEGSVEVTGCGMTTKRVIAGEELRVRCRGERRADVALDAWRPALTSTAQHDEKGPSVVANDEAPSEPRREDGERRIPERTEPESLERAASEHPSAIGSTSVVPSSSSTAPRTVSQADLQPQRELGDPAEAFANAKEARLAQSTGLAKAGFIALRRRFPGTAEAALSAFELGRIAFDVEQDHWAAATWFTTYRTEAPDGPLAREALGRSMEARMLRHDDEAAKRDARDYLRLYPDGHHVALARQLTGDLL